jgi:hypothetical protein
MLSDNVVNFWQPNLGDLTTTAFYSNHSLSNAEITSIQEQTRLFKEEEKNIRLNLEAAKLILDELRQERADNQREIVALKWCLSSLRRFPDEILRYMFEIFVFHAEISPWILMKVCRKFHSVAFATHKVRIWSIKVLFNI